MTRVLSRRAYPWYVAGVLSLAYALAVIDRQLLNLLVQFVETDLHLSDVQIGLLQGPAFAAGYLLLVPIFGALGDRVNRRNLIVAGISLWTFSTMLCGLASGFWALFGARAGVGMAEASLIPAAWSLLADCFEREQLPRAMSIFLLGPFVGNGSALILGGLIVGHNGSGGIFGMMQMQPAWRIAFVAIGMLGFAVAALALSIREPRRVGGAHSSNPVLHRPGWRSVLRAQGGFYARYFGGMSLLFVVLFALPAWTPALLMRVYGADAGRVGLEYGIATLLAGVIGVLMGPSIATYMARRTLQDSQFVTIMGLALTAVPVCMFLCAAPGYWSALLASMLASCLANAALPVSGSLLQTATPPHRRSLVTSLYAVVLALVGVGIAPALIGTITDKVLQDPGRVGISLGATCAIAALASLPLLRSAARRGSARAD